MRILYGNILNSSCNEYIILPIELLSFAVDCNKIEFITLSESNVQMFYIETSTDASSWFVIDSLIPKNYSNIPTTYSIINPNLGQYFRLKEVDYDKVLYSNIYYNKCGINIESYELYNLLGQKVEEDNLPSGIYIKKYKNKTIKIIR